jgi:hypothetical protein
MDVEDYHRPAEAGMMRVPGELKRQISPTIVTLLMMESYENVMTLCDAEQRMEKCTATIRSDLLHRHFLLSPIL